MNQSPDEPREIAAGRNKIGPGFDVSGTDQGLVASRCSRLARARARQALFTGSQG